MPRINPEARTKLVATAAHMLRTRGMNATSIRELAKEASTPLGSTYHYFPEGKKQLISEAVAFAGDNVASLLDKALQGGTLAGVTSFLATWREVVESSQFRAGCPVVAVAMEQASSEDIEAAHKAAAKVFDQWCALLRASLISDGIAEHKASALATMIIATAEGAIAMCRAKKSTKPLDEVFEQLSWLIKQALSSE